MTLTGLLAGCAQTSVPASAIDAANRQDRPISTAENARKGSPANLPGWQSDDLKGLSDAIEQQCGMRRPPPPWEALCAEFGRLDPGKLRHWLERRFSVVPLLAKDGSATGLVTGYYEPLVQGSRTRTSSRQVPLYRKPAKALLARKLTRAQIENSGMLAGTELVWLDDPIEAFFLQIQGSGRIMLREGGSMRVGYAADNGLRYRAIGRVLIERGAIPAPEISAQTIRNWLRANPEQALEVMQQNPRYVFFRELRGIATDAGPLGSLGVSLTAGRSVAIDRSRIAPGSILFLDTSDPIRGAPLRRVVIAQDTGGAIVGPIRVDLFWGSGEKAGEAAGQMKQDGRLWLLQAH